MKHFMWASFNAVSSAVQWDHNNWSFSLCCKYSQSSICSGDIKEVVNPNKSGSLLFFTHDEKYLIKTLTSHEVCYFSQMMQEYYNGLMTAPRNNTLLMQIHGLYEYKHTAGNIYVAIIKSIFPSDVKTQQFDMKGSSYDRKVII